MALKRCCYVRAFLWKLHMPNAFGGRAGIVYACHIFPQGVLASMTLVVGVAADGEAKACTGCEVGLPLCSVAVTTLSGAGSAPVARVEALRARLQLALFALSVCFSFSPHWGLCPKGGEC